MNSKEHKLRQSIQAACALSICNKKHTQRKPSSKLASDKDTAKKLKALSKKEQSLKDDLDATQNDLDAVQMEKFSVIIQYTGQEAYDLASQK